MRRISVLTAAAAAAALVVAAPLTASAAPEFAVPAAAAPSVAAQAVAPAALAHCPNGYMVATYDANVYSGWNSFRVIGSVRAGDVVRCNPGYDLGRRYTACGVTNGNGWVRLIANDGTRGWSPQACFADL
ncbi:hypothetical protein ACRAKI_18630 [Saccharothrix isguenensis]